ncbi:TetR/AcrR family transcriptional regulator [Bailinhaonella thermotolerans]|uniref:TetR/AcrR family transcriptional regulator n=1 Tax=Bailinhaonella thermotolerans TaxID=1070861 RepID=A0A3A4BKI3_9ACTN|nr:TetR/AcrR family transcriptional regulator [Bailinhaonella thermotolerans]RJL35844.1 TetR/AcrR family transcriptional regulator [Bailinhaonella thermotolerans]
MPTGVAIRDARQQLFDAAERVLLRAGATGLTSRAVTAEAGVAKGVLHKHFADFDAFLAELVRDRVARLEAQSAALRAAAGTGDVAANLTRALTDLFDPIAVSVVGLVIFRDELRARLRESRPAPGIPLLADAAAMIAAYLTEECELGRVAADTDAEALSLSLIGAAHLLFAPRESTPPPPEEVTKIVNAVLADALQRRLL